MVLETLSNAVREVSDKLHRSHKVPKFQLRDLRRTCETMLQKLGVEKEVRAHLLSHGGLRASRESTTRDKTSFPRNAKTYRNAPTSASASSTRSGRPKLSPCLLDEKSDSG